MTGCAVIAWSLGIIYNALVGPIVSLMGIDVTRYVVTRMVSAASLALVLVLSVAILGRLQVRGKDAEIRALRAELKALQRGRMAEFSGTTTYSVTCPACQSDHVIKDGSQSGEQRYRCKSCPKRFRAGGKAEGRKMDAELMGSAIRDFYRGKSYKQIAEGLHDEYDLPKEPSKATIYEWVRDYTGKATSQMQGRKAQTGGHWVADEMMVDVGGEKMWLWNVMDSETRYILASHLTPRRDANAARIVLRKAALAADAPPKTITTDKLKSYMSAVKDVLPEARHMQSEGMTAGINNNLSERLQATSRDRIKTLRGLNGLKTGQRYLDGWVLTYNLFRGHESLRNQTPGERAKVNPPFTEWADVVKAEAASRRRMNAEARPESQPKPKSPQPEAAPVKRAGARKSLDEAPAETPTAEGKRRRRARRTLAPPKPAFPKTARKRRPRNLPPPWAQLRPRVAGRN